MSWYWWLLVCWAAFTAGFLLGAQWVMASSRWHYRDPGLRHHVHEGPDFHRHHPTPPAAPPSPSPEAEAP